MSICWIFKRTHGKLLGSFQNPNFLVHSRKNTFLSILGQKLYPFNYFQFFSGGSLDLWSSRSRCHHLWNQANSKNKTLSMRSSIIEKPPLIRSVKVSYLDCYSNVQVLQVLWAPVEGRQQLWLCELQKRIWLPWKQWIKSLTGWKTQGLSIINKVIALFGLRKGKNMAIFCPVNSH